MPINALDAVLAGPAPQPLRRVLPAGAIELLYFGLKEARACLFAGLFFAAIFVMPRDGLFGLPRYDALLVVAIAIQAWMLWAGLETRDELKAVCLFHAVGFALEVFKTSPAIGAWAYPQPAYTKMFGVPLFSGFMYAAVGSYMVRVYRLFDLRFDRYPRRWITALIAAGVYVNFFAHHVLPDVRWALIALVLIAWWPTMMRARVLRTSIDLPILLPFAGVAVVIWIAENVSTWAGAWSYPDQVHGWEPVSIAKVGSWFLLMIVSVVLVTWVYPPRSSLEGAADDVADAVEEPTAGESPRAQGQRHTSRAERVETVA